MVEISGSDELLHTEKCRPILLQLLSPADL